MFLFLYDKFFRKEKAMFPFLYDKNLYLIKRELCVIL